MNSIRVILRSLLASLLLCPISVITFCQHFGDNQVPYGAIPFIDPCTASAWHIVGFVNLFFHVWNICVCVYEGEREREKVRERERKHPELTRLNDLHDLDPGLGNKKVNDFGKKQNAHSLVKSKNNVSEENFRTTQLQSSFPFSPSLSPWISAEKKKKRKTKPQEVSPLCLLSKRLRQFKNSSRVTQEKPEKLEESAKEQAANAPCSPKRTASNLLNEP